MHQLLAYRPGSIQARLPPTFNQSYDSSWTAPPAGWTLGHWKVTYSSIPEYRLFINFESDISPLANSSVPGQTNDLSSYNLGDDPHVYTIYGIDTPRSANTIAGHDVRFVSDFRGGGIFRNNTNTIELLAWGYDTHEVPFLVLYETAVQGPGTGANPAGLDIESRSEHGPSRPTIRTIHAAIDALGDPGLTAVARQLKRLGRDGRRRGEAPVVCDEACLNNLNSGLVNTTEA